MPECALPYPLAGKTRAFSEWAEGSDEAARENHQSREVKGLAPTPAIGASLPLRALAPLLAGELSAEPTEGAPVCEIDPWGCRG